MWSLYSLVAHEMLGLLIDLPSAKNIHHLGIPKLFFQLREGSCDGLARQGFTALRRGYHEAQLCLDPGEVIIKDIGTGASLQLV